MNNGDQPTTSRDDNLLNPNQALFYRNTETKSTASLKSTFSDTQREPIDYNQLQNQYATEEIKRPNTVDKIVSKVRSSLICCPTTKDVNQHRKSLSVIEVNIDEERNEVTLSKINREDDDQSPNNGCSSQRVIHTVGNLFPIVEQLKSYNKNDFIKDLFAGITIAVLHIPQGMAYGILAGVPPIYGLYTSFFPVLIYGFLGTSRHVSVGTFAVISIMLYNAANKVGAFSQDEILPSVSTISPLNETYNTFTSFASFTTSFLSTNLPPPTPIEVLTSLSLLIGLIMIIMGILNLGVLSLILSDQLITSFSSGAAIHVASSQLGYLFGFNSPKTSGIFKLIYSWIELAKQYDHINYPTLIISASVLFTLIIFKELIEGPLRKKLKIDFQIPIDLVAIIIATFVGHSLNWGQDYDGSYEALKSVKIMGEIPVGLPSPQLPRTDFMFSIIYDALAITMVIFALLISLAKLYANKFNYKISANHELIALGSANLFSSFFFCFPASVSLSRSSVQERTGAKTQMVGIVSSVIVLTILLYFAPIFYYLPKCVLACIILVALKGLFLQIGELKRTWKISRSEGVVWFITFTATVCLDVDLGLVVGVIFSLIMTLLQFTMPSSTLIGQVPFTEVYVDNELYSKAIQLKGIRIFQFSCPLFFLNCEYFKEQLFVKTLHMPFGELLKKSNVNESQANNGQNTIVNTSKRMNLKLNGLCDDYPDSNTNFAFIDDNQQTISSTNQQSITSGNQIRIHSTAFSRNNSTNQLFNQIYEADTGDEKIMHTIIIDCSGISTIDTTGVRCLEEVIDDFKKISLHCYLANCPSPLLLMFKRTKFIERLPSNSGIFATIHDAVLHAFRRTNQLPQSQFINPLVINNPQDTTSQLSRASDPNIVGTARESAFDLINQAKDITNRSKKVLI